LIELKNFGWIIAIKFWISNVPPTAVELILANVVVEWRVRSIDHNWHLHFNWTLLHKFQLISLNRRSVIVIFSENFWSLWVNLASHPGHQINQIVSVCFTVVPMSAYHQQSLQGSQSIKLTSWLISQQCWRLSKSLPLLPPVWHLNDENIVLCRFKVPYWFVTK